MSVSTAMPAGERQASRPRRVFTDFAYGCIFIVIYGFVIHAFQYHHALGESDLYRVLVGVIDGSYTGKGIASDLHYDRDFGFGYLAALYTFLDPATLRDPDELMTVMNQIGFWFMLPALLFFWCAVRLVHGTLTATVALIVFALGPMVPELATSGHQTIPMLAFLFAGATMLLLPATGWRAVLAAIAGGVLLLLGMTVRGELFLALPWLVLSRVDTRSLRGFFTSAILRAISPALALAVFIVLQHYVETMVHATAAATVNTYFLESYSWATIVPGSVYMLVGCGLATVAAAVIAAIYLVGSAVFAPAPPRTWRPADLLGPLALIVVPLLFFLPNPVPTRHFIMPLAGMSILIGMALTARPAASRSLALGAALLIGVANQVLAEAVRPTLLRVNEAHSAFLPVPSDYPTATHANLGWEWRRHAALVEKRERLQAFGQQLRTVCDAHVIVLSEEVEQLFSRLYAGGTPVAANRISIAGDPHIVPLNLALRQDEHSVTLGEGAARLTGMIGVTRGKTYIMLEKSHLWPGDAVSTLLANPEFADYKLIADPANLSIYDKAPIPTDRKPRFGCPDTAP